MVDLDTLPLKATDHPQHQHHRQGLARPRRPEQPPNPIRREQAASSDRPSHGQVVLHLWCSPVDPAITYRRSAKFFHSQRSLMRKSNKNGRRSLIDREEIAGTFARREDGTAGYMDSEQRYGYRLIHELESPRGIHRLLKKDDAAQRYHKLNK
jgi:hypothetical protein